jgi:hypothetical protein
MSRTIKATPSGANREYWASRWRRYGEPIGRATKVCTHKFERRAAKEELRVDPESARKLLAF